jgi:two-component system, OmpR family, sensor histidine kinase VicK
LTLISDREVTQVWEGVENTVGRSLDVLYKLQKSCDSCVDRNAPSVILTTEPIRQAYLDLKRRGIRIRFITEVTQENIEYCREMMKIAEVRHLDGISGNFTIADGTDYAGVATTQEAQPITQLLVSNVRAFVQQQQYFFEMLWRKAVSSEDRIKVLEEGIEPEFLEVIRDGGIAADIYRKLASSVEREALLILPSAKALLREYELGILSSLAEASLNNNAMVIKIICPVDDSNKNMFEWLMKKAPGIQILQTADSIESSILIVDGQKLLRAELRESDVGKFPSSIGFSIYTNSRPTINSFRSFFELLWNSTIINEKLKEAYQVQREFISVAAHELQTPLQSILGMSEIIESALEGHDRGSVNAQDVRMISRNARRLDRLMQDILDIARIESGSFQIRKRQFNLKDIILPLADDFRKQIDSLRPEEKNIQITISQPEKDIILYADKERITQVLSNLLTNAVKFTHSGTISIRAERLEGEYMSISITDTGSGIDSSIMPKLFSKFATKSNKGTGLGLYISKAIVEAHGGKIWAENNKDGRGAKFTFMLPTAIV